MKRYPKVPKYYHESVPDELFSAEDLLLLEKNDGQNFRIILYDSRFTHLYTDEITGHDPVDGDIFIGTKGKIRGKLSDSLDSFIGNFQRVIKYLRENLDIQQLYTVHHKYSSPVILFGEHMVKHTIDYDYLDDPPTPFIGFDVFIQRLYEGPVHNPYERSFEGFLSWSDAKQVFNSVGLETIHVVDDDSDSVNPETIKIPESAYTDQTAEGIVFRSDKLSVRAKTATDKFTEDLKYKWGLREDQADTGDELVAAWYLTNSRIRDHIFDRINKGYTVNAPELAEAIVLDIWEEEVEEIMQLDLPYSPIKFYDLAEKRVRSRIDILKTNAELNEVEVTDVWHGSGDKYNIEQFQVDRDELEELEESISQYDNTEIGIVSEILNPSDIESVLERPVEKSQISTAKNEVKHNFWRSNISVLANIDVEYTPSKINELITDAVVAYVKACVGESVQAKFDYLLPPEEV